MNFISFITFIILLRIGELIYSKRNEKWLRENSAIEFGSKHYPLIVALHVLFIISLALEYSLQQTSSINIIFLAVYAFLLVFKIWVIFSLGNFWSTKIFRIKDVPLIKKGPYKYFKHPNYFVVILEIIFIPLTFHLYYTAIIFTLLNAVILYVRIKEENRALQL